MSTAPPGGGRKVGSVRPKKAVYNHVQMKYKRLSPFSNTKSEKEDSMSPVFPPPTKIGRKIRGVQTKEDIYNRVQTKYKRLSPFSNLKSEKGGWRHAPEDRGEGGRPK